MDRSPPLTPACYRVEHHQEGLSALILSVHLREGGARLAAAAAVARARGRFRGGGWIVLIDQSGDRDEELARFPLERD